MRSGFLERRALDGLRAASEALFPENDIGAPDFRTTEMVPRTLQYLEELPRKQRRLLLLLFAFVEVLTVLFRLRRFSRLSPESRAALVRGFRRSRLLPLRILGDALKATTTVIYMSHPAALAHIGEGAPCAPAAIDEAGSGG